MPHGRYEDARIPHNDPHDGVESLGFDPTHTVEVVTNVTRENPHAALATAVAVGFVLGGGLTPKLVGAMAMFIARRYFQATVQETIVSLQETIGGQPQPKL